MSLALLRPLASALASHHLGLLADHSHRERNEHTDDLSHSLTPDVWSHIISQAKLTKPGRMEFHFAIYDTVAKTASLGTMSLPRPTRRVVTDATVGYSPGSR